MNNYYLALVEMKKTGAEPLCIGRHIFSAVASNAYENRFLLSDPSPDTAEDFMREEENSIFSALERIAAGEVKGTATLDLKGLRHQLQELYPYSPSRVLSINFAFDALFFLHMKERTFKKVYDKGSEVFAESVCMLGNPRKKSKKKLVSPERRLHEYVRFVDLVSENLQKRYNYLFQ